MKKLDYFRLFVFLFVIILASIYELSKDHKKYYDDQNKTEVKTKLVKKEP